MAKPKTIKCSCEGGKMPHTMPVPAGKAKKTKKPAKTKPKSKSKY